MRVHVLFSINVLYSVCIVVSQLGSRRAERMDLGTGEMVDDVTRLAYLGFGLWIPSLARVVMG